MVGFYVSAQTKIIPVVKNVPLPSTVLENQTGKGCDTTRHYTFTDQMQYAPIPAPGWGYVTGTNSYSIPKFAEKITNTVAKTINGMEFIPGAAFAPASAPTDFVAFKVYANAAGSPGAELASANLLLNAMTPNNLNYVSFSTPATVTGDYFVGFQVNYNATAQDTFFVYMVSKPTNSGYIFMNNAWTPISSVIQGNPTLAFTLAAIGCTTTNVENVTATKFSVSQNTPNPSLVSTSIEYQLSTASKVNLKVVDLTGRIVIEMNEGNKSVGTHAIEINTSRLTKGVYFYTLTAGNEKISKKMIVE